MPLPDQILILSQQITPGSPDSQRQDLIRLINELINHDFHALVQLLYRIDVNEKKLKSLLQIKEGMESAPVIADLIIERQMEKARSRAQYSRPDSPSEEERW